MNSTHSTVVSAPRATKQISSQNLKSRTLTHHPRARPTHTACEPCRVCTDPPSPRARPRPLTAPPARAGRMASASAAPKGGRRPGVLHQDRRLQGGRPHHRRLQQHAHGRKLRPAAVRHDARQVPEAQRRGARQPHRLQDLRRRQHRREGHHPARLHHPDGHGPPAVTAIAGPRPRSRRRRPSWRSRRSRAARAARTRRAARACEASSRTRRARSSCCR